MSIVRSCEDKGSQSNLHYGLTSRISWITGYNDSQALSFNIFFRLLDVKLVLLLQVMLILEHYAP